MDDKFEINRTDNGLEFLTRKDAPEYILCAAIHYDNGIEYKFQKLYGISTGFVLCGFRHPYIIDVLPTNPYFLKRLYEDEEIDPAEKQKYEELKYKYGWQEKDLLRCETTQGFLTSKGRFVNREEALAIARKVGQVKDDAGYKGELFSEDLY